MIRLLYYDPPGKSGLEVKRMADRAISLHRKSQRNLATSSRAQEIIKIIEKEANSLA
jgi:hypothetical protein